MMTTGRIRNSTLENSRDNMSSEVEDDWSLYIQSGHDNLR